jgi:hypothetical protein
MIVYTGADQLRFEGVHDAEHFGLYTFGTVPGVSVTLASENNGPGIGHLRYRQGSLSWKAPGSATFGPDQNVAAGGEWIVVDGDDGNKFLRVSAFPAFLPVSDTSAAVRMKVRPGVWVVPTAFLVVNGGRVRTAGVPPYTAQGYQRLYNRSTSTNLTNVRAWLEAGAGFNDYLTISDSASGPWVAPVTELTGLALAAIPKGNTSPVSLHWQIDVPGGEPPSAAHPIVVNLSWDGPP